METEEVLRDMVNDFADRRTYNSEVVDYVDRTSPPNRLGTSARIHLRGPRVARAVRRPHDLEPARAPLLHLVQGFVRLVDLPKALRIRVVADVGMGAKSELPVGALDL